MALYQNLVERCFNTCCNDFTSKALSSKEVRPIPPLSSLPPPPFPTLQRAYHIHARARTDSCTPRRRLALAAAPTSSSSTLSGSSLFSPPARSRPEPMLTPLSSTASASVSPSKTPR